MDCFVATLPCANASRLPQVMTVESVKMTSVVLDIDNLAVGLGKNPRNERIIDDVSLQVRAAETLCLAGESGSGKSVTALTVMGRFQKAALLPSPRSAKLDA